MKLIALLVVCLTVVGCKSTGTCKQTSTNAPPKHVDTPTIVFTNLPPIIVTNHVTVIVTNTAVLRPSRTQGSETNPPPKISRFDESIEKAKRFAELIQMMTPSPERIKAANELLETVSKMFESKGAIGSKFELGEKIVDSLINLAKDLIIESAQTASLDCDCERLKKLSEGVENIQRRMDGLTNASGVESLRDEIRRLEGLLPKPETNLLYALSGNVHALHVKFEQLQTVVTNSANKEIRNETPSWFATFLRYVEAIIISAAGLWLLGVVFCRKLRRMWTPRCCRQYL